MKTIPKFDDLEKANAYVTSINEAHDNAVTKTGELAKKVTDLEDQGRKSAGTIATLTGDIERLTSENELALAAIADLGEKLDLQEKHGAEGLIVSVGKKNYQLTGDKFIYDGSVKTAKELSADAVQLQKMVDKGSGSLVEVTN